MTTIIGWDIGGAHLKAARAEAGRLTAVVQIACDSHLGLAQIERAIRAASAQLGAGARHRVTMTAELSDAFENRERGVTALAAIAAHELRSDDIAFYAGAHGLLRKPQVAQHAADIASANWRVSAELVAQIRDEALFIDFGSTTTDIIPVKDGSVIARGATDAQRLAKGELVYAGFTRGAPQAYARHAPVDGSWTPLVNEAFASMADVRRVCGDLAEGETGGDLAPTADGRPKTHAASLARLARLVGRDESELNDAQAQTLADHFARAQWRLIEDQIALVLSRGELSPFAPIVGAGAGRALVARWAREQLRDYRDFADCIDADEELQQRAADCAPATALALMIEG